ncbi:MAG: hypothetical protein J5J00_02535 [Deltaproteobacteria bacterium]|nr:hypothetical protein [Deltaproteobacteria bacterium]
MKFPSPGPDSSGRSQLAEITSEEFARSCAEASELSPARCPDAVHLCARAAVIEILRGRQASAPGDERRPNLLDTAVRRICDGDSGFGTEIKKIKETLGNEPGVTALLREMCFKYSTSRQEELAFITLRILMNMPGRDIHSEILLGLAGESRLTFYSPRNMEKLLEWVSPREFDRFLRLSTHTPPQITSAGINRLARRLIPLIKGKCLDTAKAATILIEHRNAKEGTKAVGELRTFLAVPLAAELVCQDTNVSGAQMLALYEKISGLAKVQKEETRAGRMRLITQYAKKQGAGWQQEVFAIVGIPSDHPELTRTIISDLVRVDAHSPDDFTLRLLDHSSSMVRDETALQLLTVKGGRRKSEAIIDFVTDCYNNGNLTPLAAIFWCETDCKTKELKGILERVSLSEADISSIFSELSGAVDYGFGGGNHDDERLGLMTNLTEPLLELLSGKGGVQLKHNVQKLLCALGDWSGKLEDLFSEILNDKEGGNFSSSARKVFFLAGISESFLPGRSIDSRSRVRNPFSPQSDKDNEGLEISLAARRSILELIKQRESELQARAKQMEFEGKIGNVFDAVIDGKVSEVDFNRWLITEIRQHYNGEYTGEALDRCFDSALMSGSHRAFEVAGKALGAIAPQRLGLKLAKIISQPANPWREGNPAELTITLMSKMEAAELAETVRAFAHGCSDIPPAALVRVADCFLRVADARGSTCPQMVRFMFAAADNLSTPHVRTIHLVGKQMMHSSGQYEYLPLRQLFIAAPNQAEAGRIAKILREQCPQQGPPLFLEIAKEVDFPIEIRRTALAYYIDSQPADLRAVLNQLVLQENDPALGMLAVEQILSRVDCESTFIEDLSLASHAAFEGFTPATRVCGLVYLTEMARHDRRNSSRVLGEVLKGVELNREAIEMWDAAATRFGQSQQKAEEHSLCDSLIELGVGEVLLWSSASGRLKSNADLLMEHFVSTKGSAVLKDQFKKLLKREAPGAYFEPGRQATLKSYQYSVLHAAGMASIHLSELD